MNEHSRKMLDGYYEQAAGWNSDRLRSLRSSQRLAWTVSFAAVLVALFEAGAIMVMMPLKTVEPYTLLVDKTTGYVQPLKPLEPGKVAPDAALTQSYLVQYVIAREGFDFTAASTNYRRVALFSEGLARSAYLAGMQPTNPESPLALYPRDAGQERVADRARQRDGPVRYDQERSQRASANRAVVGCAGALSLFERADGARGSLREPARLPGRGLSPRSRDARART